MPARAPLGDTCGEAAATSIEVRMSMSGILRERVMLLDGPSDTLAAPPPSMPPAVAVLPEAPPPVRGGRGGIVGRLVFGRAAVGI